VTPQIDEADNIILHVHPVGQPGGDRRKVIDLGMLSKGIYKLPLAKSSVSETDSIVRLKDGEIAAIGGLMKRESRDSGSGVPGWAIFRCWARVQEHQQARQKQELVILLKPTLIKQQSDWMQGVRDASARLQDFTPPPKPPASAAAAGWKLNAALPCTSPTSVSRNFLSVLTPRHRLFLSRRGAQSALNTLLVALESGEGLIKIVGEVGSGKTLLCRYLLNHLEKQGWAAAYVPNPHLTPAALNQALLANWRRGRRH
jgi:hypothetical protein